MSDHEYQAITSGTDVIRRVDVRATLDRLAASRRDLATELGRLLSSQPVEKPPLHRGGAETDFLWLDVTTEFIDAVVDELGSVEADLVITGSSRLEVEEAARLLDVWNRAQRLRRERDDKIRGT